MHTARILAPELSVCNKKTTVKKKKKGENVSLVLSCAKPRGEETLSLRDRNQHLVGGEKKQLEAKSLWRREVQERSVCSSGNLGAPDCREAGR